MTMQTIATVSKIPPLLISLIVPDPGRFSEDQLLLAP
jgi:hypothetical protein